MKNVLCLCVVVVAFVAGSWAAQNCPNGQPLFTKVYYPEGSIKKIWYADGRWNFDIKCQSMVTLNCDRSPCVVTCYGKFSLYNEDGIHLFSCEGNQFPADPWCDDGDTRIITVAAVGKQAGEPVYLRFWVDGLRLL